MAISTGGGVSASVRFWVQGDCYLWVGWGWSSTPGSWGCLLLGPGGVSASGSGGPASESRGCVCLWVGGVFLPLSPGGCVPLGLEVSTAPLWHKPPSTPPEHTQTPCTHSPLTHPPFSITVNKKNHRRLRPVKKILRKKFSCVCTTVRNEAMFF